MPSPRPYPHLARSADLSTLWMLRMLLDLGALDSLFSIRGAGQRGEVLERLGIRSPADDEKAGKALAAVRPRLAATRARLEARLDELRLPEPLATNVDQLRALFGLTEVEGLLLAAAVLINGDPVFHAVANRTEPGLNLTARLGRMLGADLPPLIKATHPSSVLRRCGLVEFQAGGPIAGSLQLKRGGLRVIGQVPLESPEMLLGQFLREGQPPTLSAADFEHLDVDVGTLAGIVREAHRSRRAGVNLLVYGPPGTGKTELSRLVARLAGVRLYDVSSTAEDGQVLGPCERLASLAACNALLKGQPAVLCFDETDALFREGAGARVASVADAGKAFLNDLLETGSVPTVWIANAVRWMDPAFVRRFDAVVRVDVAPRRQRLAMIERECAGLLPPHEARALADVRTLTPAVVSRAAAVARRVLEPASPKPLVRSLIEEILRAQGHGPVGRAQKTPLAFDPAICNADVDLGSLAKSLRHAAGARLLLAGAPGTGKTEFGRWLAEELGRPHLAKRLSEIQGPFVGETERAIAAAFDEARREGGVLQFDEIDSLLGDRRQAQRSWEVNQVNEMLTQIESFDGVLIATTNRLDQLDPAAMRRFDYRITFDYLTPDQACALATRCAASLDLPTCDLALARLRGLRRLLPGDFAVAMRRQDVERSRTLRDFVDQLEIEMSYKAPAPRRIGLV